MVLSGLKQELTKKSRILKNKFVYLSIEINKNKKMKKVFLTLALVALVAVSCNKVTPSSKLTTVDSTKVQVDSVSIDSTSIDTTAVK
jgi:hypothetical protein